MMLEILDALRGDQTGPGLFDQGHGQAGREYEYGQAQPQDRCLFREPHPLPPKWFLVPA